MASPKNPSWPTKDPFAEPVGRSQKNPYVVGQSVSMSEVIQDRSHHCISSFADGDRPVVEGCLGDVEAGHLLQLVLGHIEKHGEGKMEADRIHPTVRPGSPFFAQWSQLEAVPGPVRAVSFITMVLQYPWRPLFDAPPVVDAAILHHVSGIVSVYPVAADLSEVQLDRPVQKHCTLQDAARAVVALGLLGANNVPRNMRGIVGIE